MFGGKIRQQHDRQPQPLPERDGSLGCFCESLSKVHTNLVFQKCLINRLLLTSLLAGWEVSSSPLGCSPASPKAFTSCLRAEGAAHDGAWTDKIGGNKLSVKNKVEEQRKNFTVKTSRISSRFPRNLLRRAYFYRAGSSFHSCSSLQALCSPRTALPEAFESFSPNQQPPGGQERRYKPLPQRRWPPVPRQGTRHPFEPSPLLGYHHSGGEVALALTSTVRPPKSCLSRTF